MAYAIRVIQGDDGEYVCEGTSVCIARFRTKQEAQLQADFLQVGLDAKDVAKVVRYPAYKYVRDLGYTVRR